MKFSEWTKLSISRILDTAAGDTYEALHDSAKDCIDSAVNRYIIYLISNEQSKLNSIIEEPWQTDLSTADALAAYRGSLVMFQPINPERGDVASFRYGRIVSFLDNFEEVQLLEACGTKSNFAKVETCKLLLRRSISLTLKERTHFLEKIKSITPQSKNASTLMPETMVAVKQLNFFRHLGIDCDGLIESGRAIDVNEHISLLSNEISTALKTESA